MVLTPPPFLIPFSHTWFVIFNSKEITDGVRLSKRKFCRVRKAKEAPELIFKFCLVYLWIFLCHMVPGWAEAVVSLHSIRTEWTKENSSWQRVSKCDAVTVTREMNPSNWRHPSLGPMVKPLVPNAETTQADLWRCKLQYPGVLMLHLRWIIDSFLNWIKTMNPLPSPADTQTCTILNALARKSQTPGAIAHALG